jgi:uncharacterized UPF0160 family protein
LLQDLGIAQHPSDTNHNSDEKDNTNGKQTSKKQPANIVKVVKPDPVKATKEEMQAKEFLLNLVKTQQLMGRQILIQNARLQFPTVTESQIEQLIQQLCQEKKVQILDPKAKPDAQLICLVPKR